MAKPRAKQTDNKVSMEEATTLGGRRKALAARRSKTELAALRETLKAQAQTKSSTEQGQDRRRTEEDGCQGQGQDSARPPCG